MVVLKRKGTWYWLKQKGDGINTETSIDDDQKEEQLEFADKESAIY